MSTEKYGIKVPFQDQELWVLNMNGEILLFDTVMQANAAANIWKSHRIVKYEESTED